MRREESTQTRVVFRWWLGNGDKPGVIALFPDVEATSSDMLNAFEHEGKHFALDYKWVVRESRPASEPEYRALKQELEARPYHYNLKVIRRFVRRKEKTT